MLNNEYSVKFTLKAKEDLDEIYSYIATKLLTQTTAESLMDKIENGIMRLKEFPFSGSCVYDGCRHLHQISGRDCLLSAVTARESLLFRFGRHSPGNFTTGKIIVS